MSDRPADPSGAAASGPIMLVMNAVSGDNDSRATLQAIEASVLANGRRLVTRVATEGAQVARLAAEAVAQAVRESGIVVAAGGDGTLNAVAQAAIGSRRPLGVLPQGTFNYFARSQGLPLDPGQAARVWLEGHVRPVQVGQVNGHVFLVNASLGLYPRLLVAREIDNRQFGRRRIVAFWAGLRTLWQERRNLRLMLRTDGRLRRIRTPTLFVANNALQLEQLGFDEAQAVQSDGRLAAITVQPVGPMAMLWLALRGAMGELGRAETVDSQAFRLLSVTPLGRRHAAGIQVAYDGEIRCLQPPLTFEVAPEPLNLLVPRPPAPTLADPVPG